jgi:hypothetical protein
MDEESLAAYLNGLHASRDVVQQALRYYLAERTAYLPPEDMREQVIDEAADKPRAEQLLVGFEQSSDALEDAALIYLAAAWADPAEREAIRSALQAANKSLPVVDIALLAVVAMYAMYLLATRGKAHEIHRVSRGKDGSFTEETETIYASPLPWLKSIVGLFPGGA